jgi:biotin carboxyl carrier protein
MSQEQPGQPAPAASAADGQVVPAGAGAESLQEARLVRTLETDVYAVLRALRGSAVEELRLERGGVRIAVRRAWTAPSPAALPAAEAAAPDRPAAAPTRSEVRAQLVGVFHRARDVDAPALAAKGDLVEAGQAIGVIETLGMANDVEAPVGGRLADLLVEDGQAVEYGEQLAVIVSE